MTALAVPLTQSQVDAACRLHKHLKQWQRSDAALCGLAERFPEFDANACLLKSVAINALYGTQVFAIMRMADHIHETMRKTDLSTAGPELVERLANLPRAAAEKERHFTSFAAKFCHFFIDAERFPIYDEAARTILKLHLGPEAAKGSGEAPYASFVENLNRLRRHASITCAGRELDRYLWIVGMYIKSRGKGDSAQKVNVELKNLFDSPTPEQSRELAALLPPGL